MRSRQVLNQLSLSLSISLFPSPSLSFPLHLSLFSSLLLPRPIYDPCLKLRDHAASQLETPFETPVGSPGSSYDSEVEYESLRAVLSKVHLGKYFGHFRRSEIRLENLEHLTEEDLMEVGAVGDVC